MPWPEFFPDNCPPPEAVPATGVVYRLIKTDTPTEQDFKSHREMKPTKSFTAPEHLVCGLSVYRDLQDISLLQRRVPAMAKSYRATARGEMTPDLGVILATPSKEESHHTWWVPVGVRPWEQFTVVQIPKED